MCYLKMQMAFKNEIKYVWRIKKIFRQINLLYFKLNIIGKIIFLKIGSLKSFSCLCYN